MCEIFTKKKSATYPPMEHQFSPSLVSRIDSRNAKFGQLEEAVHPYPEGEVPRMAQREANHLTNAAVE